MNPLPHHKDLLLTARRIIWFKEPEAALDAPIELLTYALRFGTTTDMATLLRHIGWNGLREAIDNAHPGIIDARSWAYWNARIGRIPAPPLPVRKFPAEGEEGVGSVTR